MIFGPNCSGNFDRKQLCASSILCLYIYTSLICILCVCVCEWVWLDTRLLLEILQVIRSKWNQPDTEPKKQESDRSKATSNWKIKCDHYMRYRAESQLKLYGKTENIESKVNNENDTNESWNWKDRVVYTYSESHRNLYTLHPIFHIVVVIVAILVYSYLINVVSSVYAVRNQK